MRSSGHRPGVAQAGFSLIELMVGLTVGLIVILVVTQTLAIFEGQKRTTTSGADAQQSGLLGLFSIEQDVRMAGVGFNSIPTFSCVNFYSSYQQSSTATAVQGSGFTPVPVLIQDAGTNPGANSDQIIVRTGANFAGSVPSRLLEPLLSTTTPFNLLVERSYDFTNQDLIVLVDPTFTNCTLMRVTAVTPLQRQLSVSSGQYPEFNPNPRPSGWPAQYPAQSWVYRVGTTAIGGVATRTFSVDANQSLQVVDSNPASSGILASDIVNLQAQYGLSTAANTKDITSWVNATGSFAPATLTGSGGVTDRQRIKAIRVALVARSKNREGGLVTTQCAAVDNAVPPTRPDCACQGATTNFGPCAWRDIGGDAAPRIDLRSAAGDTEWQHYRYKVYQTIIPLRNSIWPY
jgi:type IV pilus assembly protein PilW